MGPMTPRERQQRSDIRRWQKWNQWDQALVEARIDREMTFSANEKRDGKQYAEERRDRYGREHRLPVDAQKRWNQEQMDNPGPRGKEKTYKPGPEPYTPKKTGWDALEWDPEDLKEMKKRNW